MRRLLFPLYFLIFFTQFCYAQLYSFKTYTQENGLKGQFFYKIFQDSKGFIWLSSSEGVSRYNGSEFEFFGTDKYLTDPRVYEIYEDKKGHIWLGTFDGLVRYDGKNWLLIEGIKNIRKIQEDNQGRLCFFYVGHILRYDYEKFECFPHELSFVPTATHLPDGTILLSSDEKGKELVSFSLSNQMPCFVIPKDSIVYYRDYEDKYFNDLSPDEKEKKSVSLLQNFNIGVDKLIKKIFRDKSDNIWIALESGVSVFESGKLKPIFEDKIKFRVRDIFQDNEGKIYFAGVGGVFVWNGLTLQHISKKNGLFSDNPNTCLVDRQKNLWIGFLDNAVQKLQPPKFVGYSAVSKDFEGNFYSQLLAIDSFGIINFINNQGLYRFDGQKMVLVLPMPEKGITYCFVDKQNNLWVRYAEGFKLVKLTQDLSQKPKVSYLNASNGLPDLLQKLVDYPERKFVKSDGEVLIGSYYGVFRYKDGKWKQQTPLSCNAITDFAEDTKGRLWVGTWCNLCLFDNDGPVYAKADFIHPSDDLKSVKALSAVEIVPDEKGGIWINTLTQGIIYLKDTGDFYIYRKQDGLRNENIDNIYYLSNKQLMAVHQNGIDLKKESSFVPFQQENTRLSQISHILEFEKGQLWFSTNSGVFRYDGAKMYSYSSGDGLLSNKVIFLLEGKNNNLYTVHAEGIAKYSPELDVPLQHKGTLVITDIKVDNLSQYPSDTIYVANSNLSVKIAFSLLSFYSEHQHQYSYKMEGMDKDWSQLSNLNFAYYNKLDPGTYRFLLRAVNAQGDNIFFEKDIIVVVKPYFYQTIWFYVLIIVLFMGIAFGIYKFRVNQLKRQKLALEKIIELRTDEIRQKNTALQQTNQEILMQKAELEQLTDELKSTNEDLNLAYNEVERKRQNILSSINYAQKIQNGILPSIAELNTGYEHFIFYQPKDIVSGDFYWFADKGDKKIYVVADCTGHGVPGAFMTIIVNNILNHIVHEKEIHDPADILNYIPETLGKIFTEKNIKDGFDLGILTFYEQDGKPYQAAFAGALISLYYVKDKQIHEIRGDRMSIGQGFNKNKLNNYQQTIIKIDSPTVFYMSSDGFQDQFGGENFTKFLRKNFVSFLHEIHSLPLDVQNEYISRAFKTWKGKYSQTDDVLIMGILIQ